MRAASVTFTRAERARPLFGYRIKRYACARLKRFPIDAKPSGVKLNPPFRAEHIGSLLRPRELKDAFGARMRGSLAEPQFREIQERCIVDAIRLQEQAGLETITDGEFRRVAWSTGFVSALTGLESRQSIFEFRDAAGNSQRWDTCYASGRLGRSRAITRSTASTVSGSR